jgi:outer membrane protein
MTTVASLLRFTLPATLLFSAAAGLAATAESKRGWVVTIGPGIVYSPAFPGADALKLRPWPIVNVRREGTDPRFYTPDDSFGLGLIGGDRFRVGPAVNLQTGRHEKDASPGIGDVATTIEGGAFAEAFLTDHFRLRGEVRKGFGGHKGVVADFGADAILGSPSDTFHLSVGPRVRFANARYVRAFFGINPDQSLQTGLPLYDAGGGLHSAGALAYANYRLTPQIGVQAYGRYDRLLGDAKDSPLVLSSVGSRDQYEVGLGMTYTFNVR